jgi:hypothetical protein
MADAIKNRAPGNDLIVAQHREIRLKRLALRRLQREYKRRDTETFQRHVEIITAFAEHSYLQDAASRRGPLVAALALYSAAVAAILVVLTTQSRHIVAAVRGP